MYWFFYSSEYFYIFIFVFKVLNLSTASLNEWLGTKDQNKIAYFLLSERKCGKDKAGQRS